MRSLEGNPLALNILDVASVSLGVVIYLGPSPSLMNYVYNRPYVGALSATANAPLVPFTGSP
jgi:hypothetical protein